jgi:hypothetical protein
MVSGTFMISSNIRIRQAVNSHDLTISLDRHSRASKSNRHSMSAWLTLTVTTEISPAQVCSLIVFVNFGGDDSAVGRMHFLIERRRHAPVMPRWGKSPPIK